MYNDLLDLVFKNTEKAPKQQIFEHLNVNLDVIDTASYDELTTKATAIAALIQAHAKSGEPVTLIFEPGIEFIASLVGTLLSGAIAVPVFPPSNKRLLHKLQAIIEDTGSRIILSNVTMLKRIQKLDSFPWLPQNAQAEQLIHGEHSEGFHWLTIDELDYNATYTRPIINSHDTAYLQYTSGSTADPKGVMISHRNVLDNINIMLSTGLFDSSLPTFGWLPPYHDMGLITHVLYTLYAGCKHSFFTPKDFIRAPLKWLKALSVTNSGAMCGPNFAYELVARKAEGMEDLDIDLSAIHIAICGAEPIHLETVDRFCRVFNPYGFSRDKFALAYGLAEATLFVSAAAGINPLYCDYQQLKNNRVVKVDDPQGYNLVSVGKCYQQVKIVDPQTLAPVADRHIGEIIISGDSVANGYWHRDQLTQDNFHIKLENDQHEYMRTGDLGFMDEGELYITGRTKDLVIINGHNFYPHDIEKDVANSHPSIRTDSIAAFSIMDNCSEKLVVVAEYKGDKKSAAINQAVEAMYLAIVDNHQVVPHEIVLIKPKAIFKTSSGKIQRQLTKQHYEDNSLETIYTWSKLNIKEQKHERIAS